MMKRIATLADLMEHQEMYARSIAEQHGLGPLQSRCVECRRSDFLGTGVVIFTFQYGSIICEGADYKIQKKEVTT